MLNIFAFYDLKMFSEITIRPEILSKVSMSNGLCGDSREEGSRGRDEPQLCSSLTSPLPGGAGIRRCESSGWAGLAAAGLVLCEQ